MVNINKQHIFATHKELEGRYPAKSEKGIRCESGTIPVAVYPDSFGEFRFIAFFATGKTYWEGAISGMSQKTYLCI